MRMHYYPEASAYVSPNEQKEKLTLVDVEGDNLFVFS